MGAGQSTSGGSRAPAQEVKTSYYEILEVEKSATEDEIKKAYRRKALSLHPDRNYGREEAATAEFASVQSAYEVLSDPQERAWYDSHEDAILRDIDPTASAENGGAGYESSVGLTSADDVTRLLCKFHGGMTYDDSPSGFFGFLREFFEQLAHEEELAARKQDEDTPDYPSFGHKDDTHNEGVRQFYAAWSGFSTVKSFAWQDKYRTSDAEDRRMRRLIEKENARFRREGIAEFNDAVRSLIAFVRKRDPRYTPNTQTEAERQKVLQDASRAQAARMRAANERARQDAEGAVPAWARSREDEEPVGQGVEEGTFDESSSEEEHFECMACRKVFKSEKQYETHEKSNKHRKAVQALKRKLKNEGHRVGLDEDEGEENDGTDGEADDVDPKGADGGPKVEDVESPEANASEALNEDKRSHIEKDDDEDDKTTNEDQDSGDHLPTTLKDTTFDDTKHSTSHDRHANNENSTTASTPASPLTNEPKKGKAATKREKKAAQAAALENEELKFKCAVCQAAFPSKTRMHQHLKDFGHAAPPAQEKYGQPGNVRGKKKKDRNI